jgi:hypothetical protein
MNPTPTTFIPLRPLPRSLEEAKAQLADIEAAISKLDQQKLQIDKCMADRRI